MMELQLVSQQKPGRVSIDNFQELQDALREILCRYENAVYTEDRLDVAKADKKELAHLRKELDERRKEIKRTYLAPYNAFEAQVKELLLRGKTEVIKGFIAKTGMMFDAPLKLTPEGQVTFDFPEKPKPVDTTLKCPKCGQYMKKSQWYYECECGFKVAHTVAKVELEEAIMQELFETGKTKKKITGFTSKAGNVFDTCLKFEDDRIRFDFDNPGENVVLENAKPAESAQNQEKQITFEA